MAFREVWGKRLVALPDLFHEIVPQVAEGRKKAHIRNTFALLFPYYLHEYSFRPMPIELSVENLLPRPEV
jgi:hypothetical protein